MTPHPATPPDQLTATCTDCGQMFRYDPVFIAGQDFGNLAGVCDFCQTERERKTAAAEEAARRARNEAAIVATIPPDLRETDVRRADFNGPLWQAVRQWRPSAASRTLILFGHAQKCKTRCMALLAMQAIRADRRVMWTTAPVLKDCAADRHREREVANPAREHIEACIRSSWLFLDDLGKQGDWSAAFESVMFQLLDHRITHQLATVISSNCPPEQFALSISAINAPPIISRMLDRATMIQV